MSSPGYNQAHGAPPLYPRDNRFWWVIRKHTEFAVAYIDEAGLQNHCGEGWEVSRGPFAECETALAALIEARDQLRT